MSKCKTDIKTQNKKFPVPNTEKTTKLNFKSANMLRIYDTCRKKIVPFRPLRKKEVRMYACGPTVYDYAHIGNFRSFLTADIVRRYLLFLGCRVIFVQNVTDVGHLTEEILERGEDRMIRAARREKRTPEEIADFYAGAFREDAKKLNLLPPTHQPRATAYVPKIISFIETLIKKGHAYAANGSVFFSVKTFPRYGALSGNTLSRLRTGTRIEPHPDKRDPFDFALWLKAPVGHLMRWESPWGEGYPAWHIECSVMSTDILGPTLDLHMGGEDNVFPHHEDEIAQSECNTGKRFARYWIHTRHLIMDKRKLSKSLGHSVTLRDLEARGFPPLAFRTLTFLTHYRKQLNFTFAGLRAAEEIRERVQTTWENLRTIGAHGGRRRKIIKKHIESALTKVKKEMDYDMNVPRAFAAFLRLIATANPLLVRNKLGKEDAAALRDAIEHIDTIFGILEKRAASIPGEIQRLVAERERFRAARDWTRADRSRDRLRRMGYVVEDTARGPRVKRAPK